MQSRTIELIGSKAAEVDTLANERPHRTRRKL
jgi:hypothetical protein